MITCSVCDDARRGSIDAMLVSRARPMRAVARDFGVSYDSLKRHRRNGHVVGSALQYAGSSPVASSGTPEEQIRAIVASLNAIDVTKLSPNAQIALFSERRRAAESLAKVSGPSAPTTVRLQDIEGYADLEAEMFEALEKHPLARQDLARVLRGRLSRAREDRASKEAG